MNNDYKFFMDDLDNIRNEYFAGKTNKDIADRLNAAGFRTKTGKLVPESYISALARDKRQSWPIKLVKRTKAEIKQAKKLAKRAAALQVAQQVVSTTTSTVPIRFTLELVKEVMNSNLSDKTKYILAKFASKEL